MVMEPAYVLGLGGAVGAVLRYYTYVGMRASGFPAATLVVNVVGSFVAGLVVFGTGSTGMVLFFVVGVAGAYTTFSTFAFELIELWERGAYATALVHGVFNLVGSVGAVVVAYVVVRVFAG